MTIRSFRYITWVRLCVGVALVMIISVVSVPWFERHVLASAPSVVTGVVPVPANGQVTLTWTNPASVDFTGTMVRYSATAFPTSVSDGTLASDVAGTVSGTSSLTVTGLTNGTIYYFSLFSHNAIPEYSAAVNARQLVMPAAFSEDFESLTPGNVNGQNGWAVVAGTWNVLDTGGEQTLKSGTGSLTFDQYRVLNGGSASRYSNQMVRAEWRGTTTNAPGQLFLRTQSVSADAGGYVLTQSAGTIRISYKTTTGFAFTQLGSAAFTQVANTWYVYEFSVVNNSAGLPVLSAYVWTRGSAKPSTPTVTVTDTINRFAQGGFSVGKSSTTAAEYDNIVYYGMIGDSSAKVLPDDASNTLSWTNPSFASYAGTYVRMSTSAYPATVADGTLVADVVGVSGGTSSTTHSGLTNGTKYYYTLFPYDNAGLIGTPLSMSQVAQDALFVETFDALSLGSVVGQNGWTTQGGTWTVADVASDRILSGSATTSYTSNMAVNGDATTLDQILSYRFQSNVASNASGYSWLRRQSNNDGYMIWHTLGNVWTISYESGGTLTALGTAAATAVPPAEANVWFNVEASVLTNESNLPVISLFVWKAGMEKPLAPVLTVTDVSDRFPDGTFALGRNTTVAESYFDDVHFSGTLPPPPPPASTLAITTPEATVAGEPDTATLSITDEYGTFTIPYIQTSTTLAVAASIDSVPSGGGVRFILNEGLAGEQTINDLTGPDYSGSFSGLAKGEYTLDAYEILADGVTLSGDPLLHDHRDQIGIGDIITVIGDSTSEGSGGTTTVGPVTNWLEADAGSLSIDHRNFPQHGPGASLFKESYLTDLNDQLTAYFGYPVFLMNEGYIGMRAATYRTTVITPSWTTRQLALAPSKWIVAFGNGDSQISSSPATFRTELESFFTLLINTYGATYADIYLPYPFFDSRDPEEAYLASYIPEIDSMRSELGLAGGADLYNTFLNHKPAEYNGVHANATGYAREARLWALAFMQPALSTPSANGREITLNWDNLSALQPTIAGYQISYGVAPGALDQTMTVGNVTTATLTNLAWNTTYYIQVRGFDNDPYAVSYTDQSTTRSATTDSGTSSATVSAISGPTTEAGGSATFTVVLTSAPTGNVRIPVTSANTSEGTVSPSELVFTTENWNSPQTVTVTGVDDSVDDGDAVFSVVLGAATSTDITYSGYDHADVSVTNTDNDTAGFIVSAVSGDTTESGGVASFTVRLASQPVSDVSIPVSSSNTDEGTIAVASLVFTNANWSLPQPVIITGIDDVVDDGTVAYTIVLGAVVSDDPLYGGGNPGDVAVFNTDNDSAAVLITQSDGSTALSESGTTDTYQVVLATEPTFDVIIGVTSDDQTSVDVPELLFTASDWNTPQVITVSAIDDVVAEGTHEGVVSHLVTSLDTNYDGFVTSSVTAEIADNDTAGVTLVESDDATSVSESGQQDTFTVVLTSQPVFNVVVTYSFDVAELDLSDTSLTFTSANWDVPQTITVSAVNDNEREDTEEVAITSVTASDDPFYDALVPTSVGVVIVDNDHSGQPTSPSDEDTSGGSSSGHPTSISVEQPQEGDVFTAGSRLDVVWTWTGTIPIINIDLSLDGGEHWKAMLVNSINSGFASIMLPNTQGDGAVRLRGTDLADVLATETSGTFTIASVETGMDTGETPSDTDTGETPDTSGSGSPQTTAEQIAAIAERVADLPTRAAVHGLVKLSDDGNADTRIDSTVYYVGADGLRHAFPNEAIFHSWFCDFSGVHTLSAKELASITLGSNVTYRPGVRLVKFVSDPRVFAVDQGGVLRWVVSEELARALYGDNWNQFIDDIPDVYFGNYLFGSPITDVSEYDRTTAEQSVLYPSDTFAIPGYKTLTSDGLVCSACSNDSSASASSCGFVSALKRGWSGLLDHF